MEFFFLLKKFNDYSKLIFLEFMSLREKINEQFNVALKAKNKIVAHIEIFSILKDEMNYKIHALEIEIQ